MGAVSGCDRHKLLPRRTCKSRRSRIAQMPDDVVKTAQRGLKRGKAHVISGWTNFFMIESERLVPRSLSARVAGTVLKKTLTEKE